MAICYWDARMMWEARLRGVPFDEVVTIGHLSLNLHPSELTFFRRAFREYNPNSSTQIFESYTFGDYSDRFLNEVLGVSSLTIVDASCYEGANVIHDLNRPIPKDLRERFDAVIDSGSLEHVFNFPVAIANLMQMLRVGGSLFITTPANNLCGHGFYQFSPELMFRVFTPEHGFQLRRIALFQALFPEIELTSHGKAYEVVDPAHVRSRVGLISQGPVMMMVEAKKLMAAPLFVVSPLQSDYVTLWQEAQNKRIRSGVEGLLKSILEYLPTFLQARIRGYRQKRSYSLKNRTFYKEL